MIEGNIQLYHSLHNVGGEDVRQQRQRQAETEKVGPLGLDEGQPFVQLPAHVEPLVLERVKRIQQAHVQQADGVTQTVYR